VRYRLPPSAALIAAGLALVLAGCATDDGPQPSTGGAGAADSAAGMVVANRFGVAGARLELLRDGRINGATREGLQSLYWYGLTTGPMVQLVARRGLDLARLRLVGPDGAVIEDKALSSPFAELQRSGLADDFLLTVESGGFGQFNGAETTVIGIRAGRPLALAARDAASGDVEEMRLLRAAATDWRREGGRLLQVICDAADENDDGFLERFVSYSVENGHWTRRVADRRGYCAWNGAFPPAERFP